MDYAIVTEINGYQGGILEELARYLDPHGFPRNCVGVIKAAEALVARGILEFLVDGPPRIWHPVTLSNSTAWKLYRELDRDPLTAEEIKSINPVLEKLALEPGYDVEP